MTTDDLEPKCWHCQADEATGGPANFYCCDACTRASRAEMWRKVADLFLRGMPGSEERKSTRH
jgi:hypothetical protein